VELGRQRSNPVLWDSPRLDGVSTPIVMSAIRKSGTITAPELRPLRRQLAYYQLSPKSYSALCGNGGVGRPHVLSTVTENWGTSRLSPRFFRFAKDANEWATWAASIKGSEQFPFQGRNQTPQAPSSLGLHQRRGLGTVASLPRRGFDPLNAYRLLPLAHGPEYLGARSVS